MVITPDGEQVTLDGEELREALCRREITGEEADQAVSDIGLFIERNTEKI